MQPSVSVLMITRNHAPFIAKAIESVLSQKTSFSIELVIGEDASTDDTPEIIHHYTLANPENIYPFHHNINEGITRNFLHTLSRCRGKYIALLDGDDRWVNDEKLQIQVNFLEQNREVIACGGNTFSEAGKKSKVLRAGRWIKRIVQKAKTFYDNEEMAVSNRFRTPTVVVRAAEFKAAALSIGKEATILDWPLFVNLPSLNGTNKYVNLPHLFAAYTLHHGGVFSTISFEKRLKISVEAREEIFSATHGRYLGWHFPVCRLGDPSKYNQKLLSDHYANIFSDGRSNVANINILSAAKDIVAEGDRLVERFGFIFASAYLQSSSFNSFTGKIIDLMRLVERSFLNPDEKRKLLGCIGTAWRDTMFFSEPDILNGWKFILSPLRKYAEIFWPNVFKLSLQSNKRR